MLTVVVGLESSGTSSTCRPLASRYSVMPSTERTGVIGCAATVAASKQQASHARSLGNGIVIIVNGAAGEEFRIGRWRAAGARVPESEWPRRFPEGLEQPCGTPVIAQVRPFGFQAVPRVVPRN